MPIDLDLLKAVGFGEPEERIPGRAESKLGFPEVEGATASQQEMIDLVRRYESDAAARQRQLRDEYAWGLSSPLAGTRQSYLDRATKEVTDPNEQQFLISEVARVSKAQEFTRQERYKASGFTGDMQENAKIIGGGFVDAGTRMMEAATDLMDLSAGEQRTPEQIKFMRDLQSAKAGENPSIPEDANLVLKGLAQASGMAPDLAAGLMATLQAGPGAGMAYWTARVFPERREDFIIRGLAENEATVAGFVTSSIEGALELIIKDPTGMSRIGKEAAKKGLRAGLRKSITGMVEKTIDKIGSKGLREAFRNKTFRTVVESTLAAGARSGIELTEEGLQAGTHAGADAIAAKLRPGQVDPVTGEEFFRRSIGGAVEAYPGIAVLSLMGLGAEMAHNWGSFKQRRINEDILRHAEQGLTPSRGRWEKKWGLDLDIAKEGHQRRLGVRRYAAEMLNEEQQVAAIDGERINDDQMERWGLDRELFKTQEQRLAHLRDVHLERADRATKAAQEAMGEPEATEGVPSPTEVVEATEQAETTPPWAPPYGVKTDTDGVSRDPADIVPEKSDEGLVTDTAGNVGIAPDAIIGTGKKAAKAVKDFFDNREGLPESVFQSRVARDGKLTAIQTDLRLTVADFDRSAKEVYGGFDMIPEVDLELLDQALKGQIKLGKIPEGMRTVISDMRRHIDRLSFRLVEVGGAQGSMDAVIIRGLGIYVNRAYKIFEDPKWVYENISTEIVNNAIDLYMKEYGDIDMDEATARVKAFLIGAKGSGTPMDIIRRDRLGAKSLSILTRRKNIPPEILALMGEIKDPRLNYARSVSNVGQLIANHEFLMEAYEAGRQGGFFTTPGKPEGELVHPIAPKGSAAMGPLADVYTTEEIAKAFNDLYSERGIPGIWMRIYLRANGIAKAGKTVWSPVTHGRNTTSNLGFLIANGHWRLDKASKAWRTVMTDLRDKPDAELREFLLETQRLGLTNQSTEIGTLRDLMKDAEGAGMDKYFDEQQDRRFKRTIRFVKNIDEYTRRAYQAEDDFFKIFAWLNEIERYSKAKPDWSEQQIKEYTARIVRNTYPTYSLVPKGIKMIRRAPLVGAFPSFVAETYRNGYNIMKLASKELADPDLRHIGAQRVVGMMTVVTLPAIIVVIGRLLSGVTKEEEEAMRDHLPPWQRNSQIMPLGKTPEGDMRYVNLSYTDPWGGQKEVVNAFLRGEDYKNASWNALSEALSPFINDEILAKGLREAWNEAVDDDWHGSTVTGEGKAIIDPLARAVQPSLWGAGRKVYKGFAGEKAESGITYNPWTELAAQPTGIRVEYLQFPVTTKFALYDYRAEKNNASRPLNSTLKSPNKQSEGKIRSLYFAAEDARQAAFTRISKTIRSAEVLGLDRRELLIILDRSGISNAEKAGILRGIKPPRVITKSFLASMRDANPGEFAYRVQALMKARAEYEENRDETATSGRHTIGP